MKPRKQDYQQTTRSTHDRALPALHQRAREIQDFNAEVVNLEKGI